MRRLGDFTAGCPSAAPNVAVEGDLGDEQKYNHLKVIVGHGGGDVCSSGLSLALWSIPPLAASQSISIFLGGRVAILLFFFCRRSLQIFFN